MPPMRVTTPSSEGKALAWSSGTPTMSTIAPEARVVPVANAVTSPAVAKSCDTGVSMEGSLPEDLTREAASFQWGFLRQQLQVLKRDIADLQQVVQEVRNALTKNGEQDGNAFEQLQATRKALDIIAKESKDEAACLSYEITDRHKQQSDALQSGLRYVTTQLEVKLQALRDQHAQHRQTCSQDKSSLEAAISGLDRKIQAQLLKMEKEERLNELQNTEGFQKALLLLDEKVETYISRTEERHTLNHQEQRMQVQSSASSVIGELRRDLMQYSAEHHEIHAGTRSEVKAVADQWRETLRAELGSECEQRRQTEAELRNHFDATTGAIRAMFQDVDGQFERETNRMRAERREDYHKLEQHIHNSVGMLLPLNHPQHSVMRIAP